jgi:hypothetical protein
VSSAYFNAYAAALAVGEINAQHSIAIVIPDFDDIYRAVLLALATEITSL